jgi:hypothetical protein
MDERIDAFLKDILELEGVSAAAIRDGVRSYLAVYENLIRDTEPDPKNREAAAQAWRKLCRQRVAEAIAKNAGMAAGEHWKLVLSVIDSTHGPPPMDN